MIRHLERQECEITSEEWNLERAERAVQKEAFIERRDQTTGTYLASREPDTDSYQGWSTLIDQAQPADNEIPRPPLPTAPSLSDKVLAEIEELGSRLSDSRLSNVSTIQVSKEGTSGKNVESAVMSNEPSNPSYNDTIHGSLSAHRKPTFKLIDFYCPIREIYICPGRDCQRTFKKDVDFHKHLLSSVHVGGRQTCPSCLRHFNSVSSLFAHMEAPSRKCNIRHSVNYNQVLREISAGILGTGGHHADGSVKYIMPTDEGWGV
jgi:hypothetical protein